MGNCTWKCNTRWTAATVMAAVLFLLLGLLSSAGAVSIGTPGNALKDGDACSVAYDAGGMPYVTVELSYDGGINYEAPPIYEGPAAGAANPLVWTVPLSFATSVSCKLKITCSDGTNSSSNTSGLFTIDNSLPEFTTGPTVSPDGWTNSNTITIAWAAQDQPNSDGLTAEYRIDSSEDLDYTPNDSPLTLDVAGLNLAEGKHTIDIRLTDEAGNRTTKSLDFYIDKTAPNAFAPTASPAGWSKGPIRITFNATDPGAPQTGSGIDHYNVSVVGRGDYGDQVSPFDLDVSAFPAGTYTVHVTATDAAGNERSGDVSVQVDSTPPDAFSATPDATDWTKNNVNISFLTADPTPGSGIIDHYELSTDGGPYAPAASPYVMSSQGAHTLIFRAVDGAGNVRDCNSPVYTLIDKTPPHLDGSNSWSDSGSANVSVDYTVSDALSGVKSVSLWYKKGAGGPWTNSALSSATTSGTFFFHSVGDATYYFGFVIEDNAGNVTASNTGDGACNLGVDTGLPTFDSITASPHCAKAGTPVTIKFTASEGLINAPYVGVGEEDATLVNSSDLDYTFTYTVSPTAPEGPADIYIEGIDLGYNYNWTDELTQLTIDNTPPEDFTPKVTPGGWIKASSVKVEFQTTDALSGIDHYEVAVDTGAYATKASPYTLATSGLSDGIHTIHVKAIDKAGNELKKDIAISIDKAAPADFTPTANPSGWTKANSVAVTFGTTDAKSGIAHYEVALDGGAYTTQASPYNLNVSSVADGAHTVHVKAIDKAGNERIKDLAVRLDKKAPLTFVPVSSPTEWKNIATAKVTWSTTDAASGIDHYEVAVDSGAYSRQTSPYTLNVAGLAVGKHIVHVKAIDFAGNSVVRDVTANKSAATITATALTFTDPNPTLGRQFDYIFWKNWMGVATAAQNTYNINWTAVSTGKALANVFIEYRPNITGGWTVLKSSTSSSGTVAFDVSTKPESDSYQFRIRTVDTAGVTKIVAYEKFGVYDATKLVPTAQIITPTNGKAVAYGVPFAAQVQVSLPVFNDPRAPGKVYKDAARDWWFAGHALAATPQLRYYTTKGGVPVKLAGTLLSSIPRVQPASVVRMTSRDQYLSFKIVNTWQTNCTIKTGAVDRTCACQLEMKYADVVTVGNKRQLDKPNQPGQRLPSKAVEPMIDTFKQLEYSRFFVR